MPAFRAMASYPSQVAKARIANSASCFAFLAFSVIWVLVCIPILLILIPVASGFGLMVRIAIVLLPLAGLWIALWGGAGRKAAGIALLMLILVLTDLSIRRRAFSDTSLDAQNLVKLSVWGLGLLVAVLNWRHLRVALSAGPSRWLLLLASWCIFTATYSPIPMYTFGAGVAFVAMVTFAAVVRQLIDARTVLLWSLGALATLCLLSLVMYVVLPDRSMAQMEGGTIFRLAGPFGSPNNLGRVAAITLLLLYWSVRSGYLSWRSFSAILVLAVAVSCLFLSQSRTASGACLGAVAIIEGLRHRRFAFVALVLAGLTALAMSLAEVGLADVAEVVTRTGRSKELVTLTGRTAIWNYALTEIAKEPWFGVGFAATKYTMPLGFRTAWGWTSTSAHNLWLQVWLTTGLVGVFLLMAAVISQARYAIRHKDVVSGSLLLFILILGMAEPGPAGPAPNILTVVWAIWCAGRIDDPAAPRKRENEAANR